MASRNLVSMLYAHTHSLGRLREPLVFVGAGVLAGLLIFLVWFGRQPSLQDAGPVLPAAANQAAGKSAGAHEGVLGDITGEPGAEQAAQAAQGGPQAPDVTEDPPLPEDADGALAEVAADDTVTDSVANDASPGPDDVPPPADLQTYFVEVERGPGVSEVLQVSAKSAEQAMSIVRDYRGDPPVLRGPSLHPLD